MRRAESGVRSDRDARLRALEQANPAWAPWFGLFRAAERAEAGAPPVEVLLAPWRPPDAPLLHGATLRADGKNFERLVADLARGANLPWSAGHEALPLLEAALRDDLPVSATVAQDGDAALPTVLQFGLPVLLAGVGRSAFQAAGRWPHCYCPVCGAWPLRAELRGVERDRHLRCGRCAADWRASWLCCTYCGEKDHQSLGLLSAEGQLESRRVETCASCRRYLKAFAALAPASPLEMLLDDLETLELDLAARERGFSRPDALGYSIEVRVLPC